MTGRSAISAIERPPGFVFRKGGRGIFQRGVARELHCESVPVTKLAAKYGTPLYVYSATAILDRLAAFERAFKEVPHTVCYSVTPHTHLSILHLLPRKR